MNLFICTVITKVLLGLKVHDSKLFFAVSVCVCTPTSVRVYVCMYFVTTFLDPAAGRGRGL